MSDDCKECRLPPTKYGAPSQAGIFVLSEVEGVLVSNFNVPEDRVNKMLESRFGDKFRLVGQTVKYQKSYPPLFLWFFEVRK